MADTLVSRVQAATARGGTVTFIEGDQTDVVTWAQLHDQARAMAAVLQRRGVGPGVHVTLLGPTSRALVTAIQAVWLAGGTAVVLPLPMRLGSIDEFVAQTRARILSADAALLLVDRQLLAFLEPQPGDPAMVLLDELTTAAANTAPDAHDVPAIDPRSLAVLQFTSGSTADPKGVMLPHATVLANLDAAAQAARLDPEGDRIVSWLPLYHDMGLIGLLTLPMISGTDLVLAGPQDFLASPSRWVQWISDFQGTATAGPNFAYALAARALARLDGLDLRRWRLALNGAEPVDPETVERFCAAGSRHGFDPRSAFPAFGMAEVAIAGTFPEPKSGLRIDPVDRLVLETERYARPVQDGGDRVRRLALLGKPVPGLQIRTVDPQTGDALRNREVGELEIRGTSVTPGYYNHPEATAAVFHDGWLRTGDLAYLVDGELVVCGRIKDVIIVGGRNVFPEDVERAASGVDGVRPGNVIAFGVEGRRGREGLVVVAETKVAEPEPVKQAVAARVRQAVGLHAYDVVLVSPGSLPKTSSGKLQRSVCRSRYLESGLQPV